MKEINDYEEAQEHWHGERIEAGDEDERRDAQQQAMFDESRQPRRVNVGSDVRSGIDRRVKVTELIDKLDRRMHALRRSVERLPK